MGQNLTKLRFVKVLVVVLLLTSEFGSTARRYSRQLLGPLLQYFQCPCTPSLEHKSLATIFALSLELISKPLHRTDLIHVFITQRCTGRFSILGQVRTIVMQILCALRTEDGIRSDRAHFKLFLHNFEFPSNVNSK